MIDENTDPRMTTKVGKKASKTIEQIYTKKTQLEHILLRPDTYIGSVEPQTQQMWVLDPNTNEIINKSCTFVPGLYKIFDEIVVNASDNKQRDPNMSKLEVTIDVNEGSIRVWNNGKGIPVVVHQEHKIYVPELIFGHLLTGSNFDDEEEKTTGGRNGYGAKLANIFSTMFVVETVDQEKGLKYKQTFRDNMSTKSTPEITKHSGDDYTSIKFFPDLRRFKMTHLDEDIVALLSKRVYDMAGTNTAGGAKLSVYLNGTRIQAKNFQQYIGLYKGLEQPCAFERVNERWEIGVGLSDGSFQQVSFVNSICTTKGGCHVNYIADQITSKLMPVIKKRNKGQEVKANQIKNHLAIYVNALIVNPAFDSQTKENLTTKASAFGSTCVVPEKLLKQVEKSGIIDNILNWAKFKQNAELKKKSGSKRSKLLGIAKLDDANFAGTNKSKDCTLILTEGDSAKALAISGLSVIGRDYYGVFPLKGKLLNVREASHAQMMKNEEVQNIAKILGLTFGKTYEETSSLRYGHLMIMTDQDHDGSHIKGLLINFLHYFWPSLLQIDGFLQQFITPIVKCTKGNREQTFFTIPEYQEWKTRTDEGRGWKIKYYKGLGTSTSAEAKEYFSRLDTHQVDFAWDNQTDDVVDMAFAKKRVEDRKLWLLNLEPGLHIDYNVDRISYNDFVNKELILFSHADNERSIPHFMDGLKPSQRKVLYACFKRNLKSEIKVDQLAGYISEHSAYHHGEASLHQTIIGMAQNFVGSNNINLLTPCGQFGTRLMGGKDAASPRYVFTRLEAITRKIFHPDDGPLLDYLDDDGQSIEPTCYVPVIPMVLVNGSDGIGTGWSSSVPTYNPREIVANLRLMLAGQQPLEMKPWFRGFKGDVQAKLGKESNNFTVAGIMEKVDDSTVIISELPVGKWTSDYKQFLESITIGAAAPTKEDGATTKDMQPFIKDFKENHTDTTVLFTISMAPEKLAEAMDDKGGIYKRFKLEGSVSTSNMHMFDLNAQIRKFESPADVLHAFYDVRVNFYEKRKTHLVNKFTDDWTMLDNKVRFILAVISNKLTVSNRRRVELLQDLRKMGFKQFVEKKSSPAPDDSSVDSEDSSESEDDLDKGFDYLLSMKIWSLTQERVAALTKQRDEKRNQLDTLMGKTPEDLWLEDLDALEEALDEFDGQFEEANRHEEAARKKATGSRKAAKTSKKSHDDSDIESEDDSDFGDKKRKKKPAIKQLSSKTEPQKLQGTVIPRKIAVEKPEKPEKPVTTSSAASHSITSFFKKKPAGVEDDGEKVAKKSSGTVKQPAVSLEDDDDEDVGASASLADRLAAMKKSTVASVTTSRTKELTKPVKNPVQSKKVSKKASSSDEDESNDDSEREEVPIPMQRAHRTVAQKAKPVYVDSGSEDEEEYVEESDDASNDDLTADDDESDFFDSEIEAKPKKSVKPKALKKTAPVKVTKVSPVKSKARTGSKRPVKPVVASPLRDDGWDDDDDDVFSPSSTPEVKKKQKKEPAVVAKPVPAAAKREKQSQPKAVKKAKTVIVDSDEEDQATAKPKALVKTKAKPAAPPAALPLKSPKPVRERKQQNYAAYFSDSDNGGESSESYGSDSD